jgi:hypothetical protein
VSFSEDLRLEIKRESRRQAAVAQGTEIILRSFTSRDKGQPCQARLAANTRGWASKEEVPPGSPGFAASRSSSARSVVAALAPRDALGVLDIEHLDAHGTDVFRPTYRRGTFVRASCGLLGDDERPTLLRPAAPHDISAFGSRDRVQNWTDTPRWRG